MTRNSLKHLALFFLSASAAIVGIAVESVVDTDNPSEYYDKEDYEKLGFIGSGEFGTVYKIEDKKTQRIYALKIQKMFYFLNAEKEISALQQLDHENIVKMVARTDITSRHKYEPFHIVLEYMPYDLDAVLNHPEIKENTREILHQVLKGVAYIHSKILAHRDINTKNILIDPKKLSVKICDFGLCREGKEEETFLGMSIDGYYRDVLSFASLMVRLYLGESSSCLLYRSVFIGIDGPECFIKTKREGGVVSGSELEILYEEMEEVVSKNGLDLFLKLITSKKIGGCTAAAEVLEHTFFTEGREQDQLPKEPKHRRLFS
ncbi:MAG: CMGC protein kinase [Amphiamblys sp. WSBS2006]|nr:MAG: CMGC protein kinase [Amphiamblys sp. WSBS2006]